MFKSFLKLFEKKDQGSLKENSLVNLHEKIQQENISYDSYTSEELLNCIESGIRFDNKKLIKTMKFGVKDNIRPKLWLFLSKSCEISQKYDKDLFYKFLEMETQDKDAGINKDLDRTKFYSLIEIYKKHKKKLSNVNLIELTRGIDLENINNRKSSIDENENDKDCSNELNQNDKIQIEFHEKDNLLSEKQKIKIFKVTKAFSVYDSEIGYTQGINFIVGMLVLFTNSERSSFWILYEIMELKKWRFLFTKNTPKLIELLDILKNRIKEKLPKIYKHFDKIDFLDSFNGVFSHYFITIFTYNIYVEFSSRIFDLFFIMGEEIIIKTLLHLLKLKEEKILSFDLEQIIVYIKNHIVNECLEEFGIKQCLPE